MLRLLICASIIATCFAGVIDHHYESHEHPTETDHHHEIEHKHATSHQSFKIHHYHAVPTYVKKEDQQFLKHPVEIAGVKHKLKIVHPETEHNHGHGLTLENHQEVEDKTLGHHHGYDFEHHEHHDDHGHESHAPSHHEEISDYHGYHHHGHE